MKLNFLFGLLVLPGLLFADVHFFAHPPEEDPVWAAARSGYATTNALADVAAEIESATSPKLTMVPTGTTVVSTDTTVQLVPDRGIYNLYVTGDSDISFDLSSIDITNNVARWETWFKVIDPSVTVGLPSTNAVHYLETPDLTTTTANELLQVSWQAWMDGTNLMMQGNLYNRNTQMPPPTLAELRTYHYGSPTIEESPDGWFEFDPGTGTITGFNYEAGREDVVIPWEIGGVAVEAMGEGAFSPGGYGHPIETLTGPKTVLSVGSDAFSNCSSLTSISLPAATDIGDGAFSGCTLLNSVTLPAATSIGGWAFNGCTLLNSVTLPAATSIGGAAFSYCGSLNSVTLPAATDIGDYAFNGCTSLTSIYFGGNAPTAGTGMFSGVPVNQVMIFYPTGASAWSGVTTWCDRPTASYTPPAP